VREYETTFIVQPEISDEGIASLTERLDGIFEKHGAIRLMYDDQGRRRLAYEIQNFQKGRYVLLSYLDNGSAVADLERLLRLDDSVLRFLTVQVSEEVKDIEGRRAEAAEVERIRAVKAAERAQREAEEAERAQKEALAAAESAAAAEQAAAEAAQAAAAEAPAGDGLAGVPVALDDEEAEAEGPEDEAKEA